MADDKLIFPIGFDLNEGVKEALKDGDKAIERLYNALAKKPITVKLKIDSGEALSRSAKTLSGLKKEMAEINREWNALSAGDRGGVLGAQIMARYRALTQEAKGYTSTVGAAVRLEDKLAREREKSANAAEKAAQKTREYNKELSNQSSYVNNLLSKIVALWSIHSIQSFVTGVREVTAEFELQRVSLGAIIQDQQRANQLFSEIKSFALQSPLKLLDLTKYTKQVAAYGIETEKLFDTTKRLADVSVGLGVDMGRLVLAYGQVKAASYLRAAEIRQFTEAGIPMLELLAKKFTDLQGKMVSTEQVMDLVSKRAVSFSMVEEIFNDMTSAGGMFYNMQEKQAQTLFGMWSKLGDAAAVMYDEIGNTGWVNDGMKTTIGLLESMMRNWRLVGGEIIVVGAAMSIIAAKSKAQATNTALQASALSKVRSAGIAYNAILAEEARLLKNGTAAQLQSVAAKKANAKAALDAAIAENTAAAATNIWTRSIQKLKAALAGNWITLLITAVAALGVAIYDAVRNATKLDRELQNIGAEGISNIQQAVSNFQLLADKAVNAADGSKKQREALDELHRTYKDMIPAQDMTIDKLRAMKGNYEQLTIAIREYIAQQTLATKISTIIENTSADIKDYRETLEDGFADVLKLSKDQIRNALVGIEALARTTTKDTITIIREAFKDYAGIELTDSQIRWMQLYRGGLTETKQAIYGFIDAIRDQEDRIAESSSDMTDDIAYFGIYADKYKEIQDKLQKTIDAGVKTDKDVVIAKNTYLYDRKVANMQIKSDIEFLKAEMVAAGVEWQDEWAKVVDDVNSETDEISFMNWDAINKAFRDAVAGKDVSNTVVLLQRQAGKIQNAYGDLAPSNDVVKAIQSKFRELAAGMGLQMDKIKQYIIENTGDAAEYAKKLEGDLKNIRKQQNDIALIEKNRAAGIGIGILASTDDDVKRLNKEEKLILAMLKYLADYRKTSGGRTSDPRVQNLKEEISLVQKLYNEYKQLEKQEGASKAAADMRKMAGGTLDMFKERYNIDLPTDAKDLTAALEILYTKMAQLPKKVFPALDKDLKELRWTIEKVNIDESQKKIESELKRLADRISRTKTAKEFYEKILNMTGDIQLSANLAVSVYGQNGQDLQDAIREQIRTAFETDPEKNVTIDLSEAIDPDTGAINYNKLAELEEKYKDVLISGRADLRQKLIDEGRKTSAAQAQQWLKDIEKAKDFAQQRIDLATYTANQIAAINARTDLPQADKDKLTKGYQDREAKQLAKLQYDEFKDSAMYVHIFEDLDHASTTALKNMRDRLIALKGQWQHLDPTQVKELTKAIADLDEQIAGRSPFKSILDGFKGLASARPQKVIDAELLTATEELTRREEALTAATKKYTEAQTAQLNAQAEVAQARQDLEDALAVSGGEETAEVKAAREVLGIKIATFNAVKAASKDSISAAKTEVDKASEKYEEQKKVIDKLVEEGKIREANIKKIELANQKIDEYQQQINEALDGVRKMMVAFGAGDEDLQFFDDVVSSLNEIVDAGQDAATAVGAAMTGDYSIAATKGISAIGGLISGFFNLFHAGKVKRANKEIKRQQELLDQLDYTYGRLEKAADKVFGSDYISNYNQRLQNLQAQQAAYEKQAQAERSKGKKEDKQKTEEYLKKARETADEIAEMQSELRDHFLGTDIASAARDFASAWIDAKTSFADTTDAMRAKFKDMVQNMIIEAMAAKIMENALQPFYKAIDEAAADGDITADEIAEATKIGLGSIEDMNKGMEIVWAQLKQAGLDVGKIWSDAENGYTGIAKNVASATSEEINANTAALNTQNYYMSHVPQIAEHVAAMRQLMERGTTSTLPDTTAAGWTDWQRQAMDNYNAIARNTAETVAECRRSAAACEAFAADIHRIIKVKGATQGINVFLNS